MKNLVLVIFGLFLIGGPFYLLINELGVFASISNSIKNSKKKKQGYHLLKKSELSSEIKNQYRYTKFIEDISIDYCSNIKDYELIKNLKTYCKENKIDCKLPILIDEILENQKVIDWLNENEIFTRSQLERVRYEDLTKPEFCIDEFFSCKNNLVKNFFNDNWYIDILKVNELKNIIFCEIKNNNFEIIRHEFIEQNPVIRFGFQFKNINDNVIKYRNIKEELDTLLKKIMDAYCDYERYDYSGNDFFYYISDDYSNGDLIDPAIDYPISVDGFEFYVDNLTRVDLLKSCNDYYSKKPNRSLLLDCCDILPPIAKEILRDLKQ